MSRSIRQIVKIDEELCDGCGECLPSCAEGAIEIIGGKARLKAENLCDGMGACLGICPQGAITIEERPADDFNETEIHIQQESPMQSRTITVGNAPQVPPHRGGCPGARMQIFSESLDNDKIGINENIDDPPSALSHWPVQLMLVPPMAPFLRGRHIMLTADCVPFARPDFHERFLKGNAVLVGCPKLDNLPFYKEKLTEIFKNSGCTGVTVLTMEVPCCGGFQTAARQALEDSGQKLSYDEIVISVRGQILSNFVINA